MGDQAAKLAAALTLLEETLGSQLIRQEVHKIEGWNPEGTPALHPLVLLWYKAREDLAAADLTGVLPRSRWVQETLQLGEILAKAGYRPDCRDLLGSLRDKENWRLVIDRMKELLDEE